MLPLNIAIFASGGGSNARQVLRHFADSPHGKVVLTLSNNAQSGIFDFAPDFKVPAQHIPKAFYRDGEALITLLQDYQVDLIVLAGYLKLIPAAVVAAFPDRILNIHPSLLPAHGGKGMYGMRVHEAVIAAGDKESGMTVHYVNERYDEGAVIFQDKVQVGANWTARDLQQAVLKLEHQHYPAQIEQVCIYIQEQA
ncbi:MAG: phosphoribosylglycinamide formyltransferase, partial [Bacteroidota bacterium]